MEKPSIQRWNPETLMFKQTHTHTKLIFPPGMCPPGSLKLQRQQAYFFPSAGCLKYLLLSLRVSGRPECAFQMDVCHRVIDMLPAVASTNHTPAIVVQQPSDKQHDKHSHLWGHPSPDGIYRDFGFTSGVDAKDNTELIHWMQLIVWITAPAYVIKHEWRVETISAIGWCRRRHVVS